MTVTGIVMSYRWANDLLYRAVGSEPPRLGERSREPEAGRGERPHRDGRSTLPTGERARPGASADLDAVWRSAENQVPGWVSITLRFPKTRGRYLHRVDPRARPIAFEHTLAAHSRLHGKDRELGAAHRTERRPSPSRLDPAGAHRPGGRATRAGDRVCRGRGRLSADRDGRLIVAAAMGRPARASGQSRRGWRPRRAPRCRLRKRGQPANSS
jgi:hypothetical protein